MWFSFIIINPYEVNITTSINHIYNWGKLSSNMASNLPTAGTRTVVFKLEAPSESPGGHIKHPIVSDLVSLELGLRICITSSQVVLTLGAGITC